MQVICKNDLMQNITNFLEKGQESAHQIRSFFNERLGFKAEDLDDLDRHSWVTLNSFETVISMLKTSDFDQDENILIKKRKIDTECPDQCKSEEIGGRTGVFKEKRGCYKRRRTGQSWSVEVTNLTDDGHAWRKYGQKGILNTEYPRNYYRCTHKHDQGCQATKHVQQISENPTKYKLIYQGQHTCKNLLNTPSIILDESPEENSSFFLSFETNNFPLAKRALNPSLFPTSAVHASATTCMVKQEYTSPSNKVDSPPASASAPHYNQYSSSSSDNCPPSSSDITSIGLPSTPVSEQGDVILPAEFYSSTASPFQMDAYENDLIYLLTLDHQYAHIEETDFSTPLIDFDTPSL